MNVTPVANKVKLSSSLKERLKKCGRYHASPQPSVGGMQSSTKPAHSADCCTESSTVNKLPVQCLQETGKHNISSAYNLTEQSCNQEHVSAVTTESPEYTVKNVLDCESKSELSCEEQSVDSIHLVQKSGSDASVVQTPVSQKSRTDVKVKGSRLMFENHYSGTKQDCGSCVENDDKTSDVNGTDFDKEKIQGNSTEIRKEMSTSEDQGKVIPRSLLVKELAQREEELRKLRMVKMYRSKNNLTELQNLIDKWRDVSQQALQDLHSAMPEPKPTLTELINHLGIDQELIKFRSEDEEETFY